MSSKILHLGIADCDPCSARGVDASQRWRHVEGRNERKAGCRCHSLRTSVRQCFFRKHSVMFRNPAGRMRDGSRGCSRRRGSLVRRSGASHHTYPSCPPLLAPPICFFKPKLFHRLWNTDDQNAIRFRTWWKFFPSTLPRYTFQIRKARSLVLPVVHALDDCVFERFAIRIRSLKGILPENKSSLYF